MFLPTFYSCLISRIYTVHLTLNIAGCRLRLSMPVQIIMEPSEVDMSLPDDSTLGKTSIFYVGYPGFNYDKEHI
ncbi:hypothetical protein CEP53_006562 [Fusarium sp. AF-6]|nr:hypothetical protein CEP53_006562 [Fusarium sp. AF-6]